MAKVQIHCQHDWEELSCGMESDVARECHRCDTRWDKCHNGNGKYHKEPDVITGWYELPEVIK